MGFVDSLTHTTVITIFCKGFNHQLKKPAKSLLKQNNLFFRWLFWSSFKRQTQKLCIFFLLALCKEFYNFCRHTLSTYLKTSSNLTTPLQTAVHCKTNWGIDSNSASNKLVKIASDKMVNFERLMESPLLHRPIPT